MALDVPWIAEPQLRYQLELELVSGRSGYLWISEDNKVLRSNERGDIKFVYAGPTTKDVED